MLAIFRPHALSAFFRCSRSKKLTQNEIRSETLCQLSSTLSQDNKRGDVCELERGRHVREPRGGRHETQFGRRRQPKVVPPLLDPVARRHHLRSRGRRQVRRMPRVLTYISTVKSRCNEWPPSAPFHSFNRDFTLN